MYYKTILVHLDESRNVDQRIAIAASIARADNAHLTGAAIIGLQRYLYETVAMFPDDPGLAPYLDELRQRADNVMQKFEREVRDAGLPSFEARLIAEAPPGDFSELARCSDLVVLGQNDPNDPAIGVGPGFPDYVVLHCARPVLVVPYSGQFDRLAEHVLIAWNGSVEAARAVTQAMPMMRRAQRVEVVIFRRSSQPALPGQQAGEDIRRFLARHGIDAQVMEAAIEEDAGHALLHLARDRAATLMVAGCYGHSRFRELLLGGVSRTLLRSMTVPVLMSH
ncbi:MAG: universal stress protein [Pseudomonadota bacterium]